MAQSQFVSDSLALLSLEREAEVTESEAILAERLQNTRELEEKGACLQRLQVSSEKVGLYGRRVVTFELATRRRGASTQFPSNSITPGDIVGVFARGQKLAETVLSGVVTQCNDLAVGVAFDDIPDSVHLSSNDGWLQLVRLANDVTYRRLRKSLEELQSCYSGPAHHLVEVMFAEAPPGDPDARFSQLLQVSGEEGEDEKESAASSDFQFLNPALDSSQRRAVLLALSRPDVTIIHGPPGTGKTTTTVEVIVQAVGRGEKVLACAPSNTAVDNLVERLAKTGSKVIRLGHPARLVGSVLQHSLDALLLARDSAQIIQDVRRDIQYAMGQSSLAGNRGDRARWKGEVRSLRKELQRREQKALKELLSGADVVLATCTGASLEGPIKHLPVDHFDMVVIDECAQAVEASCWIPLLRGKKCVLAGDHLQLPPTILSQEAAEKGLAVTLMERLVELYGSKITAMLTTQYRMHQSIMSWPSQCLYGNQLEAHSSVAGHLLHDLPGVTPTKESSIPLLFIDTAGCDLTELDTPSEESKGNEGEADLVLHYLKALLAAGVQPKDIAVIAPYNLQVRLIRDRLHSLGGANSSAGGGNPLGLEVHSVDGFQGREKEAVLISLTRSNSKGEFGFLREQRRTNVAVTRARRHLALIGDSETVCHEPFTRGLVEHCHQHGEVWSAHEYLNDPTFELSTYYQPKTKVSSQTTEQSSKRSEASESNRSDKRKAVVHKQDRQPNTDGGAKLSGSVREESKLDDAEKEDFEAKSKFMEQLQDFMAQSKETVLSFPSALSGNERRIIHELCEGLGLLHASEGQGEERYIQVRKKVNTTVSEKTAVTDTSSTKNTSHQHQACHDHQSCSSCGKYVPTRNFELHQAHCGKQGASLSKTSSGATRTVKRVSKKEASTHKRTQDSDDLDAMLAEVSLADSTCSSPKCRKATNLLGMRCQFCNQRFCMAHSIPEVHGCAEAAKKHARSQLSKESRGASRAKPISSSKRAQLQRKLDKKIESLSSERQHKAPGSKE